MLMALFDAFFVCGGVGVVDRWRWVRIFSHTFSFRSFTPPFSTLRLHKELVSSCASFFDPVLLFSFIYFMFSSVLNPRWGS